MPSESAPPTAPLPVSGPAQDETPTPTATVTVAWVYLPLVMRAPSGPTATATPTPCATPSQTATPSTTPTLTATATRTPTLTPTTTGTPDAGWVTIVSEGFEGDFPGPWQVLDGNGATYGEYFWAKRDCYARTGSWGGWATGGGAGGAPLACFATYPSNANSWMIYGPFSLEGATAATLSLYNWLHSEQGYDKLSMYARLEGTAWYGYSESGETPGHDLSRAEPQERPHAG